MMKISDLTSVIESSIDSKLQSYQWISNESIDSIQKRIDRNNKAIESNKELINRLLDYSTNSNTSEDDTKQAASNNHTPSEGNDPSEESGTTKESADEIEVVVKQDSDDAKREEESDKRVTEGLSNIATGVNSSSRKLDTLKQNLSEKLTKLKTTIHEDFLGGKPFTLKHILILSLLLGAIKKITSTVEAFKSGAITLPPEFQDMLESFEKVTGPIKILGQDIQNIYTKVVETLASSPVIAGIADSLSNFGRNLYRTPWVQQLLEHFGIKETPLAHTQTDLKTTSGKRLDTIDKFMTWNPVTRSSRNVLVKTNDPTKWLEDPNSDQGKKLVNLHAMPDILRKNQLNATFVDPIREWWDKVEPASRQAIKNMLGINTLEGYDLWAMLALARGDLEGALMIAGMNPANSLGTLNLIKSNMEMLDILNKTTADIDDRHIKEGRLAYQFNANNTPSDPVGEPIIKIPKPKDIFNQEYDLATIDPERYFKSTLEGQEYMKKYKGKPLEELQQDLAPNGVVNPLIMRQDLYDYLAAQTQNNQGNNPQPNNTAITTIHQNLGGTVPLGFNPLVNGQ